MASLRIAVWLGLALSLASCERGPPLQRSCEGRYVDACDPYEYTEVASVTFEPSELSPGDPRPTATVHVELRTCGASTPAAPVVELAAVVMGTGSILPFDAGTSGDGTRVYQLTSVASESAASTTIDATIPNPIDGRVPTRSAIELRFTPVVAGCQGGALTIPYRTGAAPDP